MVASGGTLEVTRVAQAPRWRALALAVGLVATLWGAGFAVGRATAPETAPTLEQQAVESLPEFIRPGKDRGQVKYGPGSAERVVQRIRPGDHGGGTVKGG
jgi:hypothetical protein